MSLFNLPFRWESAGVGSKLQRQLDPWRSIRNPLHNAHTIRSSLVTGLLHLNTHPTHPRWLKRAEKSTSRHIHEHDNESYLTDQESHASEMGPDMEVDRKGKSTCVLGFQDPDLTEVPRDSPTLLAASEALTMQCVASHKYRLISGGIKTAFLSGDEDIRNIFISPLDETHAHP